MLLPTSSPPFIRQLIDRGVSSGDFSEDRLTFASPCYSDQPDSCKLHAHRRLRNGASRTAAAHQMWAILTTVHFSPCQAGMHALFSPALLMQKTKKSVAKRFKLTATGKLIRRTPGFRHLLSAKSTKQKRRASKDKLVAPGHAKPLKRCLPFGL